MDVSKEIFTCPITLQLFHNPVLAADGQFYEELEIKKWLLCNNTSPSTNLPMEKHLTKCHYFTLMLRDFYEKNPQELSNQYQIDDLHENHIVEMKEIESSINNYEFDALFSYQKFDLKFFEIDSVIKLLEDASDNVVKHFIDGVIDLEYIFVPKNKRLIHLICQYSESHSIIKYIIDKGVNLECADYEEWRPMHYICYFHKKETIDYIISKKVDTECETVDGDKPLDLIPHSSLISNSIFPGRIESSSSRENVRIVLDSDSDSDTNVDSDRPNDNGFIKKLFKNIRDFFTLCA